MINHDVTSWLIMTNHHPIGRGLIAKWEGVIIFFGNSVRRRQGHKAICQCMGIPTPSCRKKWTIAKCIESKSRQVWHLTKLSTFFVQCWPKGFPPKSQYTLSLKRNAPWIPWLPVWSIVKVKWPRQVHIWSLKFEIHYEVHLSTLFPKRNATFHGAFLSRLSVFVMTDAEMETTFCRQLHMIANTPLQNIQKLWTPTLSSV